MREPSMIAASQPIGDEWVNGWIATFRFGGWAAVGLDRCGRVQATSPGATALLDGVVRVCGGRLLVEDPLVQDRLCGLVDTATHYDPDRPMPAPLVVRHAPGRCLHVDAMPLAVEDQARASPVVALLLLRETEDGAAALAETLAQRFGLTAAEVRLAVSLADGTSLRDAAETSGICLSTARAQLKSIFSKTGTHRQGELVALLFRLC